MSSNVFEIDKIEYAVLRALESENISPAQVRLAFKTDLSTDHTFCDRYVFATDDQLVIIEGRDEYKTRKGGFFGSQKSEKVFIKMSAVIYDLSTLDCFRVEELSSSARLVATDKDKKTVLLAAFTNFYKQSAQIFVKYIPLVKMGSFTGADKTDKAATERCPVCSRRLPRDASNICPHCAKSGSQFLRMASFFAKYKGYIAAMIASFALLTVAGIIAPYLSSGFFYDEVLKPGGTFYGKILTVLFIVVFIKLINQAATMVNNYVTSIIAAKVIYDMKLRIFSSIERLSVSFFSDTQTGGLMSQVNNDSRTIYFFFCDVVPYFLIHIVQVIALAAIMLSMSPVLAIAALIPVPLYFAILKFQFTTDRKYHNRSFAALKSVNSMLSDFLTGIRVVKSFSRETEEGERFSHLSGKMASADKVGSEFRNYMGPLSSFVLYSGNVLLLGIGGYMCIKNDISYGTLLTFTAFMNMIYQPMHFFSTMSNSASGCSTALRRLFEIDDAKSEITERQDATELKSANGDIEFSNVCFSYNRSRQVLKDVSFKVKAGETLGIVGRTGAGKTTLANLIMRLYDTDSGEIFIDGHNIRDLKLQSIYANAAIVSQETHLFTGTVLDNIRYANQNATYDEVIKAAKRAGAHEFIMKLPDAYMERVGFGYKDLSGGEKQRISIARAILKKPNILILDEATAAMDTKTEQIISQALDELTRDKTTIIIAHRLSTLKGADRLIVIDNGAVVEEGTHTELLEKRGVYHKLYTLQTDALKKAGVAE